MKREREKHITRLHIILFCLVVIAGLSIYFGIKISKNKQLSGYKNLEKDMVSAAKEYYKLNKIKIEKGESYKITMEKLVKYNHISNDLTEECTGYTLIENNKTLEGDYEIEYTAYIKCGNNYISDNYTEED